MFTDGLEEKPVLPGTSICYRLQQRLQQLIAVASDLAGSVLARPVFDVLAFKTVHAQTINNQVEYYRSPVHCSPVQNLNYSKYGTSIIQTLCLGPCLYAFANKQP